jgi:hypothetical protein
VLFARGCHLAQISYSSELLKPSDGRETATTKAQQIEVDAYQMLQIPVEYPILGINQMNVC